MKSLEVPVPPNVETASGSTRRVRWHHPRKGVSDIIGNLLIIAITVTLFTALFFFVTSIPAPPAQSTSQFSAQLDIQAGNETGVNITYLTGPILGAGAIQIYLTSQLHPTAFTGCSPAGDPFTIPEGLVGAGTWVSGQTWQLSFVNGTAPGDICPSAPALSASGDNVTISIVNIAQNVLLFRVVLPGSHAIFPPEFISEGVTPSSPVIGNAFTVYAQVAGSYLAPNSVYANLSSLCGTLTPCSYASPKLMTYSTSTGLFQYTVPAGAGIAPIVGSNYPVVINASNRHTLTPILTNSVVFYVSFTSAVLFPQLEVTLSLSQGNPRVDQNITVTASVINTHQVGGTGLTVNFSAISQGVSTPLAPVYLSSGIGPAATVTAQTYWIPHHDGSWSIYAQATLTSPAVTGHGELGVTVFPRTLLIDETGVSPGSNGSLDTFTYVATDFSSAGVPFNVTVVPPGTSEITYSGTNPKTSLDMYDVIVWVLSNGETLAPSDVQALLCAIEGQRSVWLIGTGALAGANASSSSIQATCPSGASSVTISGPLTGYFGVEHVSNNLIPIPSPGELALDVPSPLSLPGFRTVGINSSNLYLGTELDGIASQGYYRNVTLSTGTAVVNTVQHPTQVLMVGNPTPVGGKSSASTFELAAIAQQMPSSSGTYVTSLAQEASMVYDTFNWLANFSATTRQGYDWAVSQVVTQPSQLSFDRPVAINFTVRNNGPINATVTATLYVNGFPVYYDGVQITSTLSPAPFGNESEGTVYWTPNFVGFLTLGIQITTPVPDTDLANNFMANSLFAEKLYVHFSVLVVDATGKTVPDTTPTLDQALNNTGFPAGTVTYVRLNASCSPLARPIGINVAAGVYNMIVWNAGENVNGTFQGKHTCALSAPNALNLTSYLNAGGRGASLLFVGNGLLSEFSAGNAPAEAFAQSYLGMSPSVSSIVPVNPGTNLYGVTGDNIGDGVNLALKPGTVNNLTFPVSGLTVGTSGNVVPSAAFYFGSTDFWTTPTQDVAATDSYSPVAGWHTAWWGFDVASVSDTSTLDLVMLRTATDFGRLLPNSDTVVGPPDITFATAQVPYMNFDEMHPQIDEQSLIRVNITNLGGAPAYGIGVSVLDGSHILDVQTLTIGGSEALSSNQIQLGVSSLSLAWTPLYAGVNPIIVEVTTSTESQILPGVSNAAEGNVTVYFFYDTSNGNSNSWTHSQVILTQTSVNPTTCYQPPGGDAFLWANINNPVEWPGFSTSNCNPGTSAAADTWGEDTKYCLITNPYCGSLGILDDNTHPNTVRWSFSSSFTVPAAPASTTVKFWQMFNLAPSASGGIVCVDPSGTTLTGGSATSSTVLNSINYCVGQTPPSPPYNSPAAPAVENGGICYFNPSFSGASQGSTSGWEQEKLNVTAYAGQTVRIAFGFVEGDVAACGGSSSPELGWFIDDFKVLSSGGPSAPAAISQSYGSCPTAQTNIPPDLWRQESQANLAQTLTEMNLPTNSVPTGSAWVAGAWSGGALTLDPNMWDSLYSRPIDLTAATSANLFFNYSWAGVFWADSGGYTPPYFYPMNPQQDFLLEIAPAGVTSTTTPWVQIWSANSWSASQYNGADAYFEGVISGSSSWTGGGVAVGREGWHSVELSLSGYAGQVIQLRFLVGTNCGNAPHDAQFNYPMGLASGALLSGVAVAGHTAISATYSNTMALNYNSPRSTILNPASNAKGRSTQLTDRALPQSLSLSSQAISYFGSLIAPTRYPVNLPDLAAT